MTTTDPTTSAVSGYTTQLDPNRRVSLSYRSDGRYLITGQTGAETRRMGLTEEAMNAAVQMYARLQAVRTLSGWADGNTHETDMEITS